MSEASGVFSCQACGRAYPWKPQYAGRKVRCRCGQVVQAPSEPPGEPEADLYGLADEPAQAKAVPVGTALSGDDVPARPVMPGPATVPAARRAAAVAPAAVAKPTLAYATPNTPPAVDTTAGVMVDPLKDIKIPLALLIGGIVVQFVLGWIELRAFVGPVYILTGIGIQLVVGTTLMLIAAFIAARFMGLAFGPFSIALLKLSAVAVAPPALAEFLYLFLQHIPLVGGLTSWILSFVFYFALLGMLFDLDQSETLWLVLVIFLVRLFAAVVLFGFLMSRIM